MSKWGAIAWSRSLPRPVRNGRFYRLGHSVALVLAGHAHADGGGITVSVKTVAEESWCTVREAQEAMEWLEAEGWFVRSDGPRGSELRCNRSVSRGDEAGPDERTSYQRARAARKQREYRARKAAQAGSCVSEVSVTVPGNADDGVTGDSYRRYRGQLPALPGTVTGTGNAPGNNRRSEPRKSLKSYEVKREVVKTRSADADAPLTLVDSPPSETPEPPEKILTGSYYEALDGNINFMAVRGIIKAALKKYQFDHVKHGVDILSQNPARPFTKQTLWNAMNDQRPTPSFTPFSNSQFDYDPANLGGFGELGEPA